MILIFSFFSPLLLYQQPYLKEILREIGTYNVKAPHKFMWELKAEYRHYQEANEEAGTS